jgi:Holliday junction resolvase-like predicted endonuclease
LAKSITGGKQRRIGQMAADYLVRGRLHDCPCRFDVVSVDLSSDRPVVEVFRDAFDVAS